MDEIREVMEPRMVHIGHDEWFQIASCERCQGKDPATILKHDINRICGYLFSHHIRCAMWGDKLMNIIVGGKEYEAKGGHDNKGGKNGPKGADAETVAAAIRA